MKVMIPIGHKALPGESAEVPKRKTLLRNRTLGESSQANSLLCNRERQTYGRITIYQSRLKEINHPTDD